VAVLPLDTADSDSYGSLVMLDSEKLSPAEATLEEPPWSRPPLLPPPPPPRSIPPNLWTSTSEFEIARPVQGLLLMILPGVGRAGGGFWRGRAAGRPVGGAATWNLPTEEDSSVAVVSLMVLFAEVRWLGLVAERGGRLPGPVSCCCKPLPARVELWMSSALSGVARSGRPGESFPGDRRRQVLDVYRKYSVDFKQDAWFPWTLSQSTCAKIS